MGRPSRGTELYLVALAAEAAASGVGEAIAEAAGAALIAGSDATTAAGAGAACVVVALPMGNSGTISNATMLMILISGLTAGPAVSL